MKLVGKCHICKCRHFSRTRGNQPITIHCTISDTAQDNILIREKQEQRSDEANVRECLDAIFNEEEI